jgi:lipid-A-disaccharide synthase
MPSICLSAGDPSGDAHAARLIETLKARDPTLRFSGLGGPAMQRASCTLVEDLTATAAIGPFDAARHLTKLLRAKRALEAHLRAQRPDLMLLVDFGDFNLPVIAPLAKRHGIPVLYYISPQLWAWGGFRLRYVKRYVDRMIVFFPFEETFYRRAGVPVTWVGHPLVEAAHPTMSREAAAERFGLNAWRRTVGLLPGSRADEVRRHLPLMLKAAQRIAWDMPGVQFLLLKAPTIANETLRTSLAQAGREVRVADGLPCDALQLLEAAIVASGTATLETALMGIPMAVVYRTSWPTYLAARLVVRIPHIALVNVVAEEPLVPEFIQHQAQPRRVADAIVALLRSDERRRQVRQGLRQRVVNRLGDPGAVDRAASAVLESLSQRSGR